MAGIHFVEQMPGEFADYHRNERGERKSSLWYLQRAKRMTRTGPTGKRREDLGQWKLGYKRKRVLK